MRVLANRIRSEIWPIPVWFRLLVLIAVIAFGAVLIAICSGQLRYWTGEEELLPQIRGAFHLVADLARPQPKVDPLVPVQHAEISPYGINTFLEQEVEPEKREQTLAMIAEAGFQWIRQEFPWEDIEIHGKGDFQDRRNSPYRSSWEKYDNIVDLAERYGLEIIARLSNPPSWSRAAGDEGGTFAPPDDFNDFGDYVETVVSRYKGRIKYYQIWNEPNIYPEWGNRPVNPEEFTELLKVAYTRAKAVDPNVVIICGALAATIENDLVPHGMSDFLFLQRMYDAGAAPYFDVMSMQGYGLWSGPYDRRMRPRVLGFSRPLYIREIMVNNGDASKAIWISEMNWNTIPPDHPAYPMFGRYSEERQAEYVVQAYRRAQLEWPWIGVVNLWYFKRATDTEKDQPMYYFRVVEPDFTPLPVYHAVQELAHSTPVLGIGTHQENHWALSYDGAWALDDVEAAQFQQATTTSNGSVSFSWRGTDLSLLTAGPASIKVSLDGAEAVIRQVGSGFQQVVLARHLRDREHTARIEITGGNLALDAVIVNRPPWWQRYPLASAAVAVSMLGAACLLLRLPLRWRAVSAAAH